MSRDVLKEAAFSLLKSAVSGVSFETSNFLTLDKYVKIRILAALNVIFTADVVGVVDFYPHQCSQGREALHGSEAGGEAIEFNYNLDSDNVQDVAQDMYKNSYFNSESDCKACAKVMENQINNLLKERNENETKRNEQQQQQLKADQEEQQQKAAAQQAAQQAAQAAQQVRSTKHFFFLLVVFSAIR